ncbi:PAS domain S-box protein [Streptomyces sp. NBC_00829]|uniref:PAS domain S-box protein n=1 Tax=Streptomyces sp. NBC_00829 TaxID=2903679 RepID=UPI00386EFC8E|nr:PAS domain S-box protein [Streptomyces sp. NBC_00829]
MATTTEEPFRALLEAAPDAMVIVDDAGVIRLVNAQTEALFGYPRQELLGRLIDILVPERFRGHHRGHRLDYAASRQVRPMGMGLDLYGLRRDGREFPVEISLSPLETPEGLLISAAVRDVSERRAAEERFRALLEAAPDAMVIVDESGAIQLVNAQTEALFGYAREELLGRPVEVLVPQRFRGHHSGFRHGYFVNRRVRPMGAGLELYGLRRDGREFPVEISLSPLETPDGTLVSAAIRDVTDRKAAAEMLAQLYEQQRHVALTLQRSLMGSPPDVPGMPTASRYFPARQGAGVGGDWFDLIPLGGGRVGIVIGDVMGRGLDAAAVMGQLRSASHALAKTGMPPWQLMRALDAVVSELPDQFVTCCYLVVDADAAELTVCSAGHLPLLLVAPGGEVSRLPVEVSVPLGVGEVPHHQSRHRVEPGSVLALYTDGLVETPGSDIEGQVDGLAAVLEKALATTDGLEEAADRLLAELLPDADDNPDDVTLLLARIPDAPVTSQTVVLAADPRSVGEGRRFLQSTLALWGKDDEHLRETACLLASELLSNAVSHSCGPVRLRLRHAGRELSVEVCDGSPILPQARFAAPDAESGRGLLLVDSLASSWGTLPTAEGKAVWFSLPLVGHAADSPP